MKAYEIREAFGIDHLAITGQVTPTPGHGQAVVRVRAVSCISPDISPTKRPPPSPALQ